jgi:hypothetical protein
MPYPKSGVELMLPIVDYGGIALVVAKITAVSGINKDDDRYGFEVYLTGKEDPVVIAFTEESQAEDARNELLGVIAQYYYIQEFGPDFDVDDLQDFADEENSGDADEDNGEKDKH